MLTGSWLVHFHTLQVSMWKQVLRKEQSPRDSRKKGKIRHIDARQNAGNKNVQICMLLMDGS